MLKIFSSMVQLDCEQLVTVYSESISQNGALHYSDLKKSEQIIRAEEAFLSYLREVFFCIKGAIYAVWLVEGRYVATLRLEPYKNGLLLEALETDPADRRKGYAYSLISAVISYLQDTDYKCIYSHIRKQNFASLHVHRKCGFSIVSEFATYIDGTTTQKSYTLRYDLV